MRRKIRYLLRNTEYRVLPTKQVLCSLHVRRYGYAPPPITRRALSSGAYNSYPGLDIQCVTERLSNVDNDPRSS